MFAPIARVNVMNKMPWKCALIKNLQRYADQAEQDSEDEQLDEWQKGFHQGIAEGLDRAVERIRKVKE